MALSDLANRGRSLNFVSNALSGGRRFWKLVGVDDFTRGRPGIVTAKLNNVDPRTWLADVLRQGADQPDRGLAALLTWNWSTSETGYRSRLKRIRGAHRMDTLGLAHRHGRPRKCGLAASTVSLPPRRP